MNGEDVLQLALNGDLSEQDAIRYLGDVCDDDELVREIVEKVASASVIGGKVHVAWNLVDWLKGKCNGNRALLAGVIALMLASGTLSAHVVEKGDTLWRLGGGTAKGIEGILALNPSLTVDTTLKPGMKIVLPSEVPKKQAVGERYVVQKGDTLSGIAKKLGMPLKDLIALNPQLVDVDRLTVGQSLNTAKPKDGEKPATGQPPATTPATKLSADGELVARVIYAESGSSVEEMEMIAHVIVNRMKSNLFPAKAGDVVRQRGQFSCVSGKDGNARWKEWSPELNATTRKACELARKVMNGDASGMKGSDDMLFYCTKAMARNGVGKGDDGLAKEYGHPSGWGTYSTFTPVDTSANHVFYSCRK